MTDEQIKQNAEEYILPLKVLPGADENITFIAAIREAFVSGAHSRDEEIKELNGQVALHKDRADYYHDLYMKLRNPWISVEDELPKKTRELELLEDEHDKVVIVCRRFGEVVTAYLDAEEIWRLYPTGRPFYSAITHWMPTPELPKGGEK